MSALFLGITVILAVIQDTSPLWVSPVLNMMIGHSAYIEDLFGINIMHM